MSFERGGQMMSKPDQSESEPLGCLSDHDRLITRPDEPLPTPLDPASPEARYEAVDPKRVPTEGQGDPDASDPAPDDLARSA
jgi:hypothetical protein